MALKKIIITAPSLDPTQNVSGVSSVVSFIKKNNPGCRYIHFLQGKADKEKGGWHRIGVILSAFGRWRKLLAGEREAIVHYSFPLSTMSILRDTPFMWYAHSKKRGMVVHVHGGLFLTAPKIPFFLNWMLRWVFSWDVPFIVLSDMEKEILHKRFGAKVVHVLPNCPDVSWDQRISRMDTDDSSQNTNCTNDTKFSLANTESTNNTEDSLTNTNCTNNTKYSLANTESTDNTEDSFLNTNCTNDTKSSLANTESTDNTKSSLANTNCTNNTKSFFANTESTDNTDKNNEPLVLGYLGRIEPNKGMTELLEACKVLKRNGVKFLLRFAGKEQTAGEYLPLFEELNLSFEYVGLVSGKTKEEFLQSLDVFVMPSYFEGLPVSLLECMGYGAVPVVTPVGSIPEVVRPYSSDICDDSCNGVFVKKKDVESIVEAIMLLDGDRELLARLAVNARRTIMENFSPVKYVGTLNDIYDKIYGAILNTEFWEDKESCGNSIR